MKYTPPVENQMLSHFISNCVKDEQALNYILDQLVINIIPLTPLPVSAQVQTPVSCAPIDMSGNYQRTFGHLPPFPEE